MSQPRNDVPCGDCSLCCVGDAVRIMPHEPQNKWDTEQHPHMLDARMLAHDIGDACVYLTDGGACSIHDDKPEQCMKMDCRNMAKALSYKMARHYAHVGVLNMAVWKRGRELLRAAQ